MRVIMGLYKEKSGTADMGYNLYCTPVKFTVCNGGCRRVTEKSTLGKGNGGNGNEGRKLWILCGRCSAGKVWH